MDMLEIGRGLKPEAVSYTHLQNNLTYSKTFGKHSVSAVAAFELMKYDYEDLYAAKKTYGQDINTSLGNAADPKMCIRDRFTAQQLNSRVIEVVAE